MKMSDLSTSWTLLQQAHAQDRSPQEQSAARGALFLRYEPLVRQYLGGAFRHLPNQREAVDECLQRFAQRLLEGAFKGASPERGRFSAYLKTALRNLATSYLREQVDGARPELKDGDAKEPAVSEEEFDGMLRADMVRRAMEGLKRQDERRGQMFYPVLHLRMQQPDWTMEQLATELSRDGTTRTTAWVRQQLHRGRAKLCECLRQEVAQELNSTDDDEINDELAALRLLMYCQG